MPYIAAANLEADVYLVNTTCVRSASSEKSKDRELVDGHAESVLGRVCSSAAVDR